MKLWFVVFLILSPRVVESAGDPVWTEKDAQKASTCLFQFVMASGDVINNITSPEYPGFYPDNMTCTWLFNATEDGSFVITVHDLRLLRDPFASWHGTDSIHIGTADNVSYATSMFDHDNFITPGTSLIVSDDFMWIYFLSSLNNRNVGFNMTVQRRAEMIPCDDIENCISGTGCDDTFRFCTADGACNESKYENTCDECSNDDFWCASGIGCLDQSFVCNNKLDCTDGSDEYDCQPCTNQTVFNMNSGDVTYFTSAAYPELYPLNLDCIWLFTAQDTGSFVVTFFDSSIEAYYDFIKIGLGHDMNENSTVIYVEGIYFPITVSIPEQKFWIRFFSDFLVPKPGFFLEVKRSKLGVECTPTQFLCHIGYGCIDRSLLCNGGNDCIDGSDELDCDFCGLRHINISRQNTYELTSLPYYPYIYPNDAYCDWLITSFDTNFVVVQFYRLHTQHGKDFVRLGTGHNITSNSTVIALSGTTGPRIVTLNSSRIWLTFTSDRGGRHWGFHVKFISSLVNAPCREGEFQCSSGYGCFTDKSILCDGVKQCLHGSDEDGCDLCGPSSELTIHLDESINFTSPNYPLVYASDADCLWLIWPGADYVDIFIKFVMFQVRQDYTWLNMGSGMVKFNNTLLKLSGGISNAPSSVISTTVMWIDFDAHEFITQDEVGFVLEIRGIEQNSTCTSDEFSCYEDDATVCLHGYQKCDGIAMCNGEIDELNCGECGVRNIYLRTDDVIANLTSPGYPIGYRDELICRWTVYGRESRFIVINILDFQMERGYDFLTIGNGEDSTSSASVVAKLTGVVKLRTITSSRLAMWIQIATDRTGTGRGFNLQLSLASNILAICDEEDFNCGAGFCADESAECDGFDDCLNQADETECANVYCPGSYPCERTEGVPLSCVLTEQVCDGKDDCPARDDEIECDRKRCPSRCECEYVDSLNGVTGLQISCPGDFDTVLEDVPALTQSLELNGGNIVSLKPGTFKGLSRLKSLNFANNNVTHIVPRAFDGLNNLTWLDMSRNKIKLIEKATFEELGLLENLFFHDVPVDRLERDAFRGLGHLKTLVIIRNEENNMIVEPKAFDGLQALETFYIDDHRLCCHFSLGVQCITLEPQPPLFNCGSLMQNHVLRVSMWVLGVSALFGNLFSVIWRLSEKARNQTQAVQAFLIGNLALADFFMGLYMVILASADLYYGDAYFIYSDEWRSGSVCRLAGFLSLFASEGSVFFLTLISYERFLGGVFPFSGARLTRGSAKTVGACLWLFTFVLSLIPVLLAGPDSDFYDLSDVCIGLPLITRPATFEFQASDVGNELTFDLPVSQDSKPAWYFSIIIFLGINLVCFVVILICYIAIFWSLKRSMAKAGRSNDTQEEMKIAIKMAIIVGTDFLCWVPVIIMGILSQTELVVIPLEAYTWCVVFVLPINSSLNPYLYTISSLISDYRSKQFKKAEKKVKQIESDAGSSTKNDSRETLNTTVTSTSISTNSVKK